MEVEEGDNEDGEEEGAVDTRSVEEVGGGDEEDEVDGRGVCPIYHVNYMSVQGCEKY